jgi:protein involved in polysaccharide export with SLBB domain
VCNYIFISVFLAEYSLYKVFVAGDVLPSSIYKFNSHHITFILV